MAQIRFDDRLPQSGIEFKHHANPTPEKYLIETMGGGVALLDYDNDGLLDIFFVNGGGLVGEGSSVRVDRSSPQYFDRLYRNRGDGSFEDVTQAAGVSAGAKTLYGMGAATGDYDNDGFVDLFVTGYGGTILYRNRGDGSFDDATERAGASIPGWSASAGFFDADLDGDLDLFVTRYLDWSLESSVRCGEKIPVYCSPKKYAPVTNVLLRNNGNGTFADVSEASTVALSAGKALGVAFNDADGDGRTDVVVANDSVAQQLFLNRGGKFEEEALPAGLAFNEDGGSFAGMGVDFEDYDNDLRPDVIVTNLAKELYALYRGDGDGAFGYATRQSNLAEITSRMSGWGVKLVDFDHDGWKDLFVAQSHVLDNVDLMEAGLVYEQAPLLARNESGRFADVSATAGGAFGAAVAGRGAAFGDLDNDGDVDVVVGVLDNSPLLLYSAASTGPNRWLKIRLVGRATNRDGQGATVVIESSSAGRQTRYSSTAGGYLSAHDPRLHFGVGTDARVDRVVVRWPGGVEQIVEHVETNQTLKIEEPPL